VREARWEGCEGLYISNGEMTQRLVAIEIQSIEPVTIVCGFKVKPDVIESLQNAWESSAYIVNADA
jgi:hypothetical protein